MTTPIPFVPTPRLNYTKNFNEAKEDFVYINKNVKKRLNARKNYALKNIKKNND